MSEEHLQRPLDNDDRAAWAAYWQAQGMPWRTEPEIDAEWQAYLAERRAIQPDIKRGIYPFRDENGNIKLTLAWTGANGVAAHVYRFRHRSVTNAEATIYT